MRITITRKTVIDEGRPNVVYSVVTDFCIWSGMDGFGKYVWSEFELPDKDGIHTFDLREVVRK